MNYHQTRYEQRKKKRYNRLLNTLIAIVILLIIYFAANVFLGSSPSDEAATTVEQEQEENNSETNIPIENESDDKTSETQQGKEEKVTPVEDELVEVEENEEVHSQEIEFNGQWSPIGTIQQEPFEATFSKGTINWEEMTRALQYATGLGEEMIIWRIGNGGDLQSAVGIVSSRENRDTPYQVRLEWVPYEGWLPTEKILLNENPY